MDLITLVANPENAALVAAITTALETVKKAAPGLSGKSWWARLLPVLPVVLGALLIHMPGLAPSELPDPGARTLLGAMIGAANAWGFKVVSQSVRRKDTRIKSKAVKP